MLHSPQPWFSVLVLSGGKSSRMGRDKALLELAGETLLERAIKLGQQLGAAQVLVSRNQPGFIQDQIQNAGPMAGIAAALPYCASRWLLVLPVDMPLLTPVALSPLLQATTSLLQGCFVAGFPLPVLLKNTSQLQQRLATTLADPTASRSLNHCWQALGLLQLPLTTSEAFSNTNDPTSFAAVRSAFATLNSSDASCRSQL